MLAKALKVPVQSLLPTEVDWTEIPFPSPEHLEKRRKVIRKVKKQARRKKA